MNFSEKNEIQISDNYNSGGNEKVISNSLPSENNYDRFAKCLTEKGMKMYGADWCGHCQNQKSMFGDSFQYVTYIECEQNKDICNSEGIRGYPTWKYNGQSYPGEKTLQGLSELSGCELN
jgi:hypothetical protein